jgi:predicted sugar kinase
LGLAVARALNAFTRDNENAPDKLAASVGRGQRSAVGTYGFSLGGLIAEEGKIPGETLAPLETRIALPEPWRWLLIQPQGANGLHGRSERQAFSTLDDVSEDHRQELAVELRERLIPAARRGDFLSFSDSLFRFGYRAGLCFKDIQGGAYHGPRIEQIVSIARSLGISGVGQSSWGPTVFGLCPDESAAQAIARKLRECLLDADTSITGTANQGAQITVDGERISS